MASFCRIKGQNVEFLILSIIVIIKLSEGVVIGETVLSVGYLFLIVLLAWGRSISKLVLHQSVNVEYSCFLHFLALVFALVFSFGFQFFILPGSGFYYGDSVKDYVLDLSLVVVLWFLVGCFCSLSVIRNSSLMLSSFVFFASLLFFVLASVGVFGLKPEGSSRILGGGEFSHLMISDYLIIAIMLCFFVIDNSVLKYISLFCGFVLLVFSGGKSAIFILVVTFAFKSLFFDLKRNFFGGFFKVFMLFNVFVALFVVMFVYFEDNPGVNRILAFYENPTESQSLSGRLEQLRVGLTLLPAQVLAGNLALIVEEFGGVGNYIHNILSALQVHGFLFFLVVIFSIFCCWRKVFNLRLRDCDSGVIQAFVCLLFYSTLSVILVRSHAMPLLWFCLGFWLAFNGKTKESLIRTQASDGRSW